MTLRTLTQRIKAAYGMVVKGSSFPFNVLADNSANRTSKMDRPYEESVWVSRAIKKVSQPIAAVPLQFSRDGRHGDVKIQDDKLTAFWSRPAMGMTYFSFIESTVGWLNLAGEAFWILDDRWSLPYPDLLPGGQPQLQLVRPDCMREIVDGSEIIAWEYRDTRRSITLAPEQVIQTKFWNPYNDFRGLAPWLAARCATEADYYACTFNRNLWQNNGDRGPIIVGRNGIADDAQRQQIIDQLRAKRAAASRGDYKAVFLTGDIEVRDPMVQTLDANAVATRIGNRHEIALAFGVPPSMFDIQASYSIGSASDRFVLIEETCMPMAENIADSIEIIARRMTKNESLYAWFDWDEHSVMQQVRGERVDAMLKLFSVGMPVRDINDYLKMGMPKFEGWETGYLPFSVTPAGMDAANDFGNFPDETEEPEEEEDDDEPENDDVTLAIDALRGAVIGRAVTNHGGEAEDPSAAEVAAQFQANRPRRERQLALSHMASRAKVVRAYQSKFNRVLMKARGETLAKLDALDASKGVRKAVTEVVFDENKFAREMQQAFFAIGALALQHAGEQVFAEVTQATGQTFRDPWKTPQHEVIQFNRLRENKIVNASRTIFREINEVIETGITKGDSIATTANRVRETFNGISKSRAKTIAMTEAGAAYGQGRQLAMKASGAKYKQWITSGRDNVRDAHVRANLQLVPMDQPFFVGGENLMSPGDTRGRADNVINCHCVAVPTNNPNPNLDDQ